MNDKQRAEFEKWAVSKEMSVRRSPYNNDEYTFKTTQYCWAGWQAAIASVVVELPLHTKFSSTYYYKLAMKESIEKAGVKHYEQ